MAYWRTIYGSVQSYIYFTCGYFYKFNVFGFLQWGYNFYYNQGSYDPINPYLDSTGNYFVPSGDAYSVYPARDGTALESIRIIQFRQGIDDLRAMKLAETLVGRDTVIGAVEELTGEILFSRCVCDSAVMHAVRERVNRLIAGAAGRQCLHPISGIDSKIPSLISRQ